MSRANVVGGCLIVWMVVCFSLQVVMAIMDNVWEMWVTTCALTLMVGLVLWGDHERRDEGGGR